MKVVISGGIKTQNIVDGINRKFSSGGVDFIVVPFIDDIDDIYQRGEYFDKAIIIEQSWTHDNEDEDDEYCIRNRINQFANESASRSLANVTYVFLSQTEEMANKVYEEILPIRETSAVLMKSPRYAVSFFQSLVTTEVDRFPEDIVYKPQFESEIDVGRTVDEPTHEPEYTPDYESNVVDNIIGGNTYGNGGRLPIDQGINLDGGGDSLNPLNSSFDNNFGIPGQQQEEDLTEKMFDPDYVPPNSGQIPSMGGGFDDIPNDPSWNSGFGGFDDIPSDTEVAGVNGQQQPNMMFDDNIVPPMPQSGEIRDFSNDPYNPGTIQMPDIDQFTPDTSGMGFGDIDGFDIPGGNNSSMGMPNQNPMNNPQSGQLPDQSSPMHQQMGYQQPGMNGMGAPGMAAGMGAAAMGAAAMGAAGMGAAGMWDDNPMNPGMGQNGGMSGMDPYNSYNPDLDTYNPNPGMGQNNQHQDMNQFNGIDDSDYNDSNPNVEAPTQRQYQRIDLSDNQIKATLNAFANRGNSIVVTGCGGCGTSTVALNLANVINSLGYSVLLVDLDTKNKTQSYISRDNYECVEPESAGLMSAINSTSGINAHIAISRQGFHLLTMGLGSDSAPVDKIIQRERIPRFINLTKTSHNFVVYDIPFETAVGFGSDFIFMADNIVIVTDCSNWGITKMMINMCNLDNDDMMETMFGRGQILFNRYRVLNRVMGRKVKTAMDITKVMDSKVRELLGEDPGVYFQSMHICGLVNEDNAFEGGWYESTQYSDTSVGSKIFLDMLKNIVLNR